MRAFSFSWPCPRKLREIVKSSAFVKENAETCTMLWNEYHHAKPHLVSTVLTERQYSELMSKGKGSPVFIFPVPKGEAPNHFVLVSQFQDKSFVITFLGDFQRDPTAANPYMVLTCFDELISTKGIVPMRGDLISNLNEDEGKALMTILLNSYLRDSQYEVVRAFNHEPESFKYEEYIQNALSEFNSLKKHLIETKEPQLNLGPVAKYGHKTDKELKIVKGGIIR